MDTRWSGRRDSNPRHLPWEDSALPTELRADVKWGRSRSPLRCAALRCQPRVLRRRTRGNHSSFFVNLTSGGFEIGAGNKPVFYPPLPSHGGGGTGAPRPDTQDWMLFRALPALSKQRGCGMIRLWTGWVPRPAAHLPLQTFRIRDVKDLCLSPVGGAMARPEGFEPPIT